MSNNEKRNYHFKLIWIARHGCSKDCKFWAKIVQEVGGANSTELGEKTSPKMAKCCLEKKLYIIDGSKIY